MKKGYRKSLCLVLVLSLLAVVPVVQASDSATQAPVVQVAEVVDMTMAPGAGDPTGLEAPQAEETPGAAPAAEDPAATEASAPAEVPQEGQDSGAASETKEDASFTEKMKDALRGEVTVPLLNLTLQLWIIIAAAAGVVLLVLVLVLLLTRKKKHRKKGEAAIASEPLSPAVLSMDQELPGGGNMLSLDDEPTVNLTEETPAAGFNTGVATVDVDSTLRTVTVQLRLFYGDEYMDTSVRLAEGQQAAVGRAGDAEIQTNPADVSVSHRHGRFSVQNGELIYTDSSRNGSRFNGLRTLANGESVAVPFNTRSELEIGAHRIWIIARK